MKILNVIYALVIIICFALLTSCKEATSKIFSENEYKAHLEFLADDLLQGRQPGTAGGDIAALYIARQFEEIGLEPIDRDQSYFQYVPMFGITPDYSTISCKILSANKQVSVRPFEEIILSSMDSVERVDIKGDLIFVGYGTVAPEYNWDDFKDVDVSGKIIVVLCNDPDYEKTGFGAEGWTSYSHWRYKEDMAILKGAKGIIYLHTTDMAGFPFSVIQYSATPEMKMPRQRLKTPLEFYAWLSSDAFEKVFELDEFNFKELKEKADSREFKPVNLNLSIESSFKQKVRLYQSPNVIGLLPGTGSKDEYILYTAHYDHLGIGRAINGDSIYNGAQDNASGTAAILCLAQAHKRFPPKRNVLFIATTEEEGGLNGSKYFTAHPLVPLKDIKLGINIDMLSFLGERAGISLNPVNITSERDNIEKLAEAQHMKLFPEPEGSEIFRTDISSFLAKNVIMMQISMEGDYLSLKQNEVERFEKEMGNFYHQPKDEIYPFFRYDGIIQVMDLIYEIGNYYANSSISPIFVNENPLESAGKFSQVKVDAGIY